MRPALLLFLTLATPLAAQSPVVAPDMVSDRLTYFETGVICPPPSVGTVPAPGTVAGTTHLIEEEPPFVSTGTRVPAVLGIGFGVKSQSTEPNLDSVDITVTHPAMGAQGATRQTFHSSIRALEPSLTFYQFDFDYELVEGLWQIEASRDGEILYRTTFEVVPAQDMPALARLCGFEDLLS